MASIRIEFVTLTRGVLQDGRPEAVIGQQIGDGVTTSSPGSVVAPANPSGQAMFARMTAIGGPVIASVGGIASQTVGLRLITEGPEVVPVQAGVTISFVDAAS
jgi:hypothetical protein